jgi:hypothetical protein
MLGELVQTTAGKWIIRPPTRCPNGHQLGPGEVLVGYQACLGHGGGHTTWTCRTCDQTVYGPPLKQAICSVLDGPALYASATELGSATSQISANLLRENDSVATLLGG